MADQLVDPLRVDTARVEYVGDFLGHRIHRRHIDLGTVHHHLLRGVRNIQCLRLAAVGTERTHIGVFVLAHLGGCLYDSGTGTVGEEYRRARILGVGQA